MRGLRPGSLLLLTAALSGCATGAEHLRKDIQAGKTPGAYIEAVPFEPQKPETCGPCAVSSLLGYWGRPVSQDEVAKAILPPGASKGGALAFDLWRYVRKAGLASLQAKGLSDEGLDALLSQKVPVILDIAQGGLQHYVVAVGHDRGRKLWVIQDGRRADAVVPEAWLRQRWEAAGRWALIAFPPERWVSGLGPALHLKAAERVMELKRPAEAEQHLAEALKNASAETWTEAGRVDKSWGRAGDAEKAYRQAMHLDPKRPDAFNNLAQNLLENPRRLDEAEALARTAVSLSQADAARLPYALDTLGQVFLKQGRKEEADKVFALALKILPPESDLAKEIRGRRAAD